MEKENLEIIFLARGGQGAKTASELLAHTAVEEGKFVKAFPFFGPERSGAPTKMFLRISEKEIRTQEPIIEPNVVVVMDETVIKNNEFIKNLDSDSFLIVNSNRAKKEIEKELNYFQGKLHLIEANEIARRLTSNTNPNSVLIGKLIQITEIVSLERIVSIFRQQFTAKFGTDLTEKNVAAIYAGYDSF